MGEGGGGGGSGYRSHHLESKIMCYGLIEETAVTFLKFIVIILILETIR